MLRPMSKLICSGDGGDGGAEALNVWFYFRYRGYAS